MITGRELTAEERAKEFRRQRSLALSFLLTGLVYAGLGIDGFARHKEGGLVWLWFVGAIAALGTSCVSWSRASKYAN